MLLNAGWVLLVLLVYLVRIYVGKAGEWGRAYLPGNVGPSTPLLTSGYSAIVYRTVHTPRPRGYPRRICLRGDLLSSTERSRMGRVRMLYLTLY